MTQQSVDKKKVVQGVANKNAYASRIKNRKHLEKPIGVHRRNNRGFTMVELMVASVLGSMVILSVYSVFVRTSRYYNQQLEQTQVQASTRFAMEYLKAELRDLGRLSVLNTAVNFRDPLYCGIRVYQGLTLHDNDVGGNTYTVPAILAQHQIAPDRLKVLIDASDATPLNIASQNGQNITLVTALSQSTLEARRMLATGAESRFRRLFDNRSLARITNLETGQYDVIPVRAAQLQNEVASITLESAPCLALNCHTGNCVINPIHWVEYVVLFEETQPEHTYFVRRRLDPNDATPIADSELLLADYAIDFQVWGYYDTRQQNPNAIADNVENRIPFIPADRITHKDDRGNWDASEPETLYFEKWGHRLRGLHIMLSTRASRIDPLLKSKMEIANAGPQERIWLEIDNGKKNGLTRVSSLIGTVETPNLYQGQLVDR